MLEELVSEKIALAKAGDSDAASWLMNEFAETVKNYRSSKGELLTNEGGQIRTVIDERLLDWFADCFKKIEEGIPCEKALGISRDKGRPANSRVSDFNTCVCVAEFRRLFGALGIEEAKDRAARKLKLSRAQIDRAWKNKVARMAAELTVQLKKGD